MLKDIKGFEGLYAVDETGQIWSYPKSCPFGKNGGIVTRGGYFIKQHKMKRTNHLRVWLYKDKKRFVYLVHRLVAEAFLPNENNLPIINHKDCDPSNNNIQNLEWCTYKHNSKHAYENGRWTPPNQSGSKNSRAILTESDIIEIREKYKTVKNCSKIAEEYNVKPKTINQIINLKRWAHI